METIFRGENILEFIKSFPDDTACLEKLAEVKWSKGYKCRNCEHHNYSFIARHFSRECTRCHYTESASAHTLFHKVKFGIQKAFCIVFEMSCTTKGLSTTQIAKRYGITQKTAWLFSQKVKLAMKSSMSFPMQGNVQVDEFVVGGKEIGKQGRSYDTKKSKVVCAVELTDQGKIKRGYAKIIDDYSAESIKPIFDSHISKEAKVKTDKWTAYNKIAKEYNITQEKSSPNSNFKQIHTIIQQIKSGIRTIQTHVMKEHLQKYLDEFFYRLNRSIHKETIFDNLIKRMVNHHWVGWKQIIVTK
jgi:ribosomal protein S27AE/transposase-like protein